MVSFRPHTIRLVRKQQGYYDNDRNYVEGKDVIYDADPCRFEPNGKARTMAFGDGKGAVYDYTVYLCTSCRDYRYGDEVLLFDKDGECIGRFKVLGFHRGQLNAKLWV